MLRQTISKIFPQNVVDNKLYLVDTTEPVLKRKYIALQIKVNHFTVIQFVLNSLGCKLLIGCCLRYMYLSVSWINYSNQDVLQAG